MRLTFGNSTISNWFFCTLCYYDLVRACHRVCTAPNSLSHNPHALILYTRPLLSQYWKCLIDRFGNTKWLIKNIPDRYKLSACVSKKYHVLLFRLDGPRRPGCFPSWESYFIKSYLMPAFSANSFGLFYSM